MTARTKENAFEVIASERVLPFYYNDIGRQFVLDGEQIWLDPDWEVKAHEIIVENKTLVADQLNEHGLVFGGIASAYGLPKLTDYLQGLDVHERLRLSSKTAQVMQNAHSEVRQHLEHRSFGLSLGAFSVNFNRANHSPDLSIGVHTSVGAIAMGSIGESGWPLGILEFGTNNEEMIEDRAALFAGLGFIAAQII